MKENDERKVWKNKVQRYYLQEKHLKTVRVSWFCEVVINSCVQEDVMITFFCGLLLVNQEKVYPKSEFLNNKNLIEKNCFLFFCKTVNHHNFAAKKYLINLVTLLVNIKKCADIRPEVIQFNDSVACIFLFLRQCVLLETNSWLRSINQCDLIILSH